MSAACALVLATLAGCDGDGGGSSSLDATVDGAQPGDHDTGTAPPPDAGTHEPDPDSGTDQPLDSGFVDASAPVDAAADTGVDTGVDAYVEPPHPLEGSYAVRTVLYARQKAPVAETSLDTVSKLVVYSNAQISADGEVTEQLCFMEIVNNDGIFSWTQPAASANVPATVAPLLLEGEHYVRALDSDRTYLSWSPENQPADCVPGEVHASGCTCFEGDDLPNNPEDCRVGDLDQDGLPGGLLLVNIERPIDPATAVGLIRMQIAGTKAIAWSLPLTAGDQILGGVTGDFVQAELSREENEYSALFGEIRNAVCPGEFGHVELVRGEFDCAQVLAGRTDDVDGHGLFDVELDGLVPELGACPDPDCGFDTDADGTVDCEDACWEDAEKTETGICGCGVADTNTDGDTQADCNETCDADPNKLAPGACGCGVADTNTDGDGQADCLDQCDADPNKTAPGACGCGVADTNTDGDSQADCLDQCDNDANKLVPGVCGCGVADTNTDGDSQLDCNETCDTDRNKLAPGICGCGVADTNTDGDSQADCNETCDTDPAKTAPGLCGCGVADTNSDGDSQPNCNETCDTDPNKLAPGACGCGVADTNTDGDSQADCNETCDTDPNKLAPGLCGCGVRDTNTDGDSLPDCTDQCDSDPNKTVPGVCGCGVRDADLNGDGTIDCSDSCPNDPAKVAPGLCGCGVPDTNTDGDSLPDCTDQCDADPLKALPGACGCGVADTNSDGDSQPNCNETCDTDPNKLAPGICGCGVADTNTDGDSQADCNETCDTDPNKTAPGLCGCGVAENACAEGTLPGTYAVRSILYSKGRTGNTTSSSKAVNYSLVTITANANGTMQMVEQACYTYTVPIAGTTVYSWSKPEWLQAVAPSSRVLVENANGTWTRQGVLSPLGWNSTYQPAVCTASSTPRSTAQGWNAAWGSTCRCTAPATALPPFSTTTPYDCRLVDADMDGYPGISAFASLSAPANPSSDASGLSWARVMAAANSLDTWTITLQANRNHTATLGDSSVSQVVGCVGGGLVNACTQISSDATNVVCPEQYNLARFLPVTASSDTCSEIVTNRDTLFSAANDGTMPNDTVCPPP